MSLVWKLPRQQVESLRIRDVQSHLTSRGWTVDEAETTNLASVYQNSAFIDAEILLPLDEDLLDYTLRMADIVQALAILEKRDPLEILDELSYPPSDVLRLRVVATEATLGSLPLSDAIRLIQGGRDMLLSAACSTIRPQAFHPEKSLKQANDFIDGCRFGQTKRGSFVANIIAPVPPDFQQTTFAFPEEELREASEPFARRVTTRLMQSLGIVEQTVKTARLDPIFDGISEGVSANLCEAVAALNPHGDQSRVDIQMGWSRSRPRLPRGVPQVVTFARADVAILVEAGRKLRERTIPRRERFVGSVFSLQAEPASLLDEDKHAGKIIVRTQVGGQPARIKVVLNREDYRLACDAHRDDQRVEVTGLIHHDVKVRVYELSEPSGFRVLDD